MARIPVSLAAMVYCALVTIPASPGQAGREDTPGNRGVPERKEIRAPSTGTTRTEVETGEWPAQTDDAVAQRAYLKASNTNAGDRMSAVAASGNTVVIGAYDEDSNATGVDGDQDDNSAMDSGAAYVVVRNGPDWSQQAYLKGSNTDPGDLFGFSVSVSADTTVVGAWREASNATGVNGDEDDNSAQDAGAAYVFERNEADWSQRAYLKAGNTDMDDLFGSVAVSDDTVIVGAQHEDSSATGVNGDQLDDSAPDAGAAYIFDLEAWTDTGCALPGVAGDPELVGTGSLIGDSATAFGLSHARPSAPCVLFASVSSTPTPFKGGTLKAFPPVVAPLPLLTSPVGTLSLVFRAPAGLPSGTNVWAHFVIQDAAAVQGFALSNAIIGAAP